MTFRRVILACALFAGVLRAQSSGDQDRVEYARRIIIGLKTVEPADGYVPDASAAIAIGTAVLAPIYGRSTIDAEQPWNAGLKDGVWTVVGTFNGRGNGGEAIVQINKKTGAVLFVGHTM